MRIKAFTKSYGSFRLECPELSFAGGKIYAVVGTNGCGKSTLAKVISGITQSDNGTRVFDGQSGYMPQMSFAFSMSVKKNIMLNTADEAAADELLQRLGLAELSGKNAKRLSGGQTAKLALARLIVRSYELLILDEPTASMDMKSCLTAEQCMKEYAEGGAAVLLITHSLQQARRIADEIIYIEDGKIIERGAAAELLAAPRDDKTAAFIEFYGL